MPTENDPIVDNWYSHLDKGQLFTVVEVGDDSVDIQYFDGDLEEMSLTDWYGMNIELSAEPENWSGAMDIAEKDDLGTEVTDTRAADWSEPLQEHRPAGQEGAPGTVADEWTEEEK
ncbi:DUF6763 family protein [Sulfuriflexus mobilis]|uniref:DUF6763 family protein n=1 Tax=Sulfuriflexus mobilis TaxID=1811807 RepID=UPI000F82ABA1|nr:DUF6763 family protein [Sulfuriflexus mobilis]